MDNRDLKLSLKLKDDFSKKRFNEKVELLNIRDKLMVKILKLRDEIATKRHNDRLQILKEDY